MMKVQVNDDNSVSKNRQLEEGYKLNEAGELVPDYDHTIKFFEDGDIVKGIVVRIDRDEVLVDVGYKSEGVIPVKELSIRKNVDPSEIVQLGSEIDTYVLQKEDADGRLVLSKKRAEFEKAWERVQQAFENNEVVEGTAIEVVKGGLILDVGVRGFLPASLVDINRIKDLTSLVHQTLECKIIELNRNRNNVVLSRKAILQGEKQNKKSVILNKISKGQILKGKISSIVDFGAFVDLGGVDGLIHISELSWNHIDHPSEIVTVGDEVKVQVLEINKDKNRVSLGLKQTQEDFWKKTVDSLNVGDLYKAKVIRILPFGVFVQFENNLEGLIHVSELSHGRVENPHKHVKINEELEVKLLSIDSERRRISLSLKQTIEPAEESQESVESQEPEQAEVKSQEEATDEVKTEDKEAQEKEVIVEKVAVEEVEAEVNEPTSAEVEAAKVAEEVVEKEAQQVVEAAEEIKAEEVKAQTEDSVPVVEEAEDKADEATDTEKVEVATETEEETEKKEIKIKPAEEKLREELAKEKEKEEDSKKALDALSGDQDNNGGIEASDSDNLEDILEQMKKSHGSKD